MDVRIWCQFGHQRDAHGCQIWYNISFTDIIRTSMGRQPTIFKFGQNLTFPRHSWCPQDVQGTWESHILARIWHVHHWSNAHNYRALLTSPAHLEDVRSQRSSLARIWCSQDISDVTGCPRDIRTLVLHPWTGPGMSETKIIIWPESDFIHLSQFLTSRGLPGDVIFWHQILTSWRHQDLTFLGCLIYDVSRTSLGRQFITSVICQHLILSACLVFLIYQYSIWINKYLVKL